MLQKRSFGEHVKFRVQFERCQEFEVTTQVFDYSQNDQLYKHTKLPDIGSGSVKNVSTHLGDSTNTNLHSTFGSNPSFSNFIVYFFARDRWSEQYYEFSRPNYEYNQNMLFSQKRSSYARRFYSLLFVIQKLVGSVLLSGNIDCISYLFYLMFFDEMLPFYQDCSRASSFNLNLWEGYFFFGLSTNSPVDHESLQDSRCTECNKVVYVRRDKLMRSFYDYFKICVNQDDAVKAFCREVVYDIWDTYKRTMEDKNLNRGKYFVLENLGSDDDNDFRLVLPDPDKISKDKIKTLIKDESKSKVCLYDVCLYMTVQPISSKRTLIKPKFALWHPEFTFDIWCQATPLLCRFCGLLFCERCMTACGGCDKIWDLCIDCYNRPDVLATKVVHNCLNCTDVGGVCLSCTVRCSDCQNEYFCESHIEQCSSPKCSKSFCQYVEYEDDSDDDSDGYRGGKTNCAEQNMNNCSRCNKKYCTSCLYTLINDDMILEEYSLYSSSDEMICDECLLLPKKRSLVNNNNQNKKRRFVYYHQNKKK